jgi:putative tryptophan/tyrosine transport system substrate-binding protein
MRRREFITIVAGALTVPPLAARAQPDRIRHIAVLIPSFAQTDREGQARVAAFVDALRRLGWADHVNAKVDFQWASGEPDRVRIAAEELVASSPDIIVVVANIALAQVQRLTSTIPVVFLQVGDPVGSGFIASLAHPGGNITGFQSIESSLGGKWLELLKEVAPSTKRAAVLFGSDISNNVAILKTVQADATSLGIDVIGIDVVSGIKIDQTITDFASQPHGGLIVVPHANVVANRGMIIALATRYRLPAIYPDTYFAAEGGLLSYGPDQIAQWRSAATYVDRILRGERPNELPVQGPTKFDIVVNLKTAKVLGLSVPQTLLATADEIIE